MAEPSPHLRRVLLPEKVNFTYDPKPGAKGSYEAELKRQRGIATEWLMRQDQTNAENLKPGDLVYLKLSHHHAQELGPHSSTSEYGFNYYLHQVVEHQGEAKLRNLVRVPAAPAASGVWLTTGTLMPLPKRQTVFRVFPAWL